MRYSTFLSIIYINLKIFFLKIFSPKSVIPYKILINLTDLCNSRCQFCDIWKIKPENEIGINDLDKLFKHYSTDLYWLSLSGGEVTLVKYYKEMIDSAVTNCKNLKILAFTTNALAVNRAVEYAKYAKSKGLDVLVTISLDGDEKTHDEIRGVKGNYKKCIELYKRLKEEKINTNFGITLSENNFNFVKKYYKDYNEMLKAVTFVHSHGIYSKENTQNDSKIIESLIFIDNNFYIKKFYEFIEKIHIRISVDFLKQKRTKNIIPCDVINTSLHLMPNGDIKPCMFMNKIGNFRNTKLKDVLKSEEVNEIKNKIKKDNCPHCWMNCYSVHSIMQYPFKSLWKYVVNEKKL